MKLQTDLIHQHATGAVSGRRKLSILVTGGAGFIGSHLCDRLIQEGHNVICTDNLYTGQWANIRPLQHHPHFQFIKHDIRQALDPGQAVDQIYNLACPASPRHYQRDPMGTLLTCVVGMKNVLELAKRNGASVLQASTSEVYGDPEQHPQTEDYVGHVNPIGPRACYDEGKRAAETLCFDYHRVYGEPVKVARIFNTYGPRMLVDDGRVVSNFIVQALRNEQLTVYGDGRQTRSFCYVDDLVEGLIRLMAGPSTFSGPCNLGNPTELTVGEIANLIVRLTGSTSRVVHTPLPQDDPRRRRPAVERAAEILGWRPRVRLEEGLKYTIAYFALALAGGDAPSIAPMFDLRFGCGHGGARLPVAP